MPLFLFSLVHLFFLFVFLDRSASYMLRFTIDSLLPTEYTFCSWEMNEIQKHTLSIPQRIMYVQMVKRLNAFTCANLNIDIWSFIYFIGILQYI